MGFDQYHEPPDELPPETRTFARLCASLTEEAEAIGWYEQRLAVEPNAAARAVMSQRGRRDSSTSAWTSSSSCARSRSGARSPRGILFQEGDIVAHGEEAEEAADDDDPTVDVPLSGSASLGIGSLRGRGL